MNRIRDELRRAGRRPRAETLDEAGVDPGLSPLEAAIGREMTDRYEAALARLRAEDREVLIARVELGMTYAEIAAATGRPSTAAARMAVVRALVRLTDEMGRADGGSTST
jgi:RNA polymerase sigma-70 factor (ECF subfamily)